LELQALAELALTVFDPPRKADHAHLMGRCNTLAELLGKDDD
jgi:hypothetical protein